MHFFLFCQFPEQIASQLDHWNEKLQMEDPGREITESLAHYEQMLRVHNDSASRVQNSVYQVLQRGQELYQVKKRQTEIYQTMAIHPILFIIYTENRYVYYIVYFVKTQVSDFGKS